MAQQPKRREVRRPHLDAAVVPVERALLARAEAIERQEVAKGGDLPSSVGLFLATEFRALAEELHFW